MKWYYFVGLIAAVTVVMLAVGWIGNKAVDGTENALRARRLQKKSETAVPDQQPQRLADRFSKPAQTPPVLTRKARFCAECGAALADRAKFCPMCGAAAESYRSRE